MQFAFSLSPLLLQINATFCAASVMKYNYFFTTMHTKCVTKIIGITILNCTLFLSW